MLGEKIKPNHKGFFAKNVESKKNLFLEIECNLVYFIFFFFPFLFIVRVCGVCVVWNQMQLVGCHLFPQDEMHLATTN